ncbi:MAG: hypothetical protein FWG05_05045, partial [Kiritimatiellaeota bacterium]|nr:hypothetical protein [Kiritimatiellota bacterium]
MKQITRIMSAVLISSSLARAAKEVPLINPDEPARGWTLNLGWEFPGAKGELKVDDSAEPQRRPALRLDGDFSGGGNYVDAGRDGLSVEIDTLTYWVKAPAGVSQMTVRLIDGSDQCHQLNLKSDPSGNWQQVILPVIKYFEMKDSGTPMELVQRYENWGGANDGKWHQPLKGVHFLTGAGHFDESKKGSVWFSGMKAVAAPAKSYKESFESDGDKWIWSRGWEVQPKGAVWHITEAGEGVFDGASAMRLKRDETQLNENVSVTGATFDAAPGAWNIGGATRSELHSPDNSFNVTVTIETLGADGKVIERKALVEQTGSANWKPFSRLVEFPKGTEKARFAFTMNKTHGWFDVDALTAAPFESKAAEKIVERIVITGSTFGHMFMPEAPVDFEIDVQTGKPLPAGTRVATVTAHDYWGAEILPATALELKESGKERDRFRNVGKIGFPADAFEVGKYYELHVKVEIPDYAEAFEFSGFARLPEAE